MVSSWSDAAGFKDAFIPVQHLAEGVRPGEEQVQKYTELIAYL